MGYDRFKGQVRVVRDDARNQPDQWADRADFVLTAKAAGKSTAKGVDA